MEIVEILREASNQIYQNVKDLAGTEDAAGDFGIGAGGDISRNIDIIAEKTVLDYLKKINFECVVLGEECGRVELSCLLYTYDADDDLLCVELGSCSRIQKKYNACI